MKICACCVVYKEQDTIAELIESISGFADELILVYDGEYPDKTIEIAEKIGHQNGLIVRSFLHPHTGDPEYLRPIAYAKADCEWILAIDGDERLRGNLDALKRFLNDSPDISRIKFLWGTEKEISSAKMSRFKPVLFRPDRCYMIGVLTESVKIHSGQNFTYGNDVVLEHTADRRDINNFIRKSIGWSRRHAESICQADERKFSTFNATESDIETFLARARKMRRGAAIRIFASPALTFVYGVRDRISLYRLMIQTFYVFLLYSRIFLKTIFRNK